MPVLGTQSTLSKRGPSHFSLELSLSQCLHVTWACEIIYNTNTLLFMSCKGKTDLKSWLFKLLVSSCIQCCCSEASRETSVCRMNHTAQRVPCVEVSVMQVEFHTSWKPREKPQLKQVGSKSGFQKLGSSRERGLVQNYIQSQPGQLLPGVHGTAEWLQLATLYGVLQSGIKRGHSE